MDPVKSIAPFQAKVTGSIYGPLDVDRSLGGWSTSWASCSERPGAEVYLAVVEYQGRTLQLVTLSDHKGRRVEFRELIDLYIDFGQDIERDNYDDDFSDPESVDREASCRLVHAQISELLGPEFNRFDDYECAEERETLVAALCAADWDFDARYDGRFPDDTGDDCSMWGWDGVPIPGEPGENHPWIGPLPADGPQPVPEKYRAATIEARRERGLDL